MMSTDKLKEDFTNSVKLGILRLNEEILKIPMTASPMKIHFYRGKKEGLYGGIQKLEKILEKLMKL